MIRQHIVPSLKVAQIGPINELNRAVDTLQSALETVHSAETDAAKAAVARTLRLETMIAIREICDEAEAVCPASLWSLATYSELQFLVSRLEAASTFVLRYLSLQ